MRQVSNSTEMGLENNAVITRSNLGLMFAISSWKKKAVDEGEALCAFRDTSCAHQHTAREHRMQWKSDEISSLKVAPAAQRNIRQTWRRCHQIPTASSYAIHDFLCGSAATWGRRRRLQSGKPHKSSDKRDTCCVQSAQEGRLFHPSATGMVVIT